VRVRADEVRVIAHRGSSDAVPEHTLAAYRQAIDEGADALEADVRLTADGHLVCVHDRRIERTSNGRGVLSTLELADLQQLDFGSWKQAEDRTSVRDGVRSDGEEPDRDDESTDDTERRAVLTLDRLIRLTLEASRPVGLAIETKHPTRYAGLVEQKLVELLRRYDLADPPHDGGRVHVMSFSELALRRMRRMAPSLPLVMLMERVPLPYRSGQLPAGFHIAGPAIEIVREHPSYVDKLHRRGHPTFTWTVDEPDDVAAAIAAGVDAIITNRPAFVLEQLGRSGVGA
jgi:glycerophosphoryl diester phosphodiesterase